MAKIVVFLEDPEVEALYTLAEREYRDPRAEVAFIVRQELKRRGLLKVKTNSEIQEPETPVVRDAR